MRPAEMAYRQQGEQNQADRVWLRQLYFAQNPDAGLLRKAKDLSASQEPRLRLAAMLAFGSRIVPAPASPLPERVLITPAPK